MANPYFQRIIGSGFPDVMEQNRFWAGFNNRTTEANLARAAQAQEGQNRWLANAAMMANEAQDRNVRLQLSADQMAREQAWRERQAAVDAQRWAEQMGWTRESEANRLAEEKRRTEAMDFATTTRANLAREQMAENIDLQGQSFAQQYAGLEQQAKRAQDKVDVLEAEQKALEDEQKTLATKFSKSGYFGVGKGLDAVDTLRQENIALRLADLKKELSPKSPIVREAESAQKMLENAGNQFFGTDYTLDKDAGVIRHKLGKVWNFRQAVEAAKNPAPTMPIVSAPEGAPATNWMTDLKTPVPAALQTPWSGFTSGTGTTMPESDFISEGASLQPTKRYVWDRARNRPVLVQ